MPNADVDASARLVERLGALVAEADSYMRDAAEPKAARLDAALVAATEAIRLAVVGGCKGGCLRAAWRALTDAENAVREVLVEQKNLHNS